MAGLAIGRMTRTSARKSPQPSTLAASTYSLGMVSRNCRSRKIENASVNAIGMISGHRVPDRCSSLAQNRYIGTMTTCGGSIIVEITSIIATLRPRNLNLARAYATGMLDTSVSPVPRTAYRRVFFHQVRNPGVFHTVLRFSQCQESGLWKRVSAFWSLITAVRATKTNGRTKNSAAAIASECTATHCRNLVRRASRSAVVRPGAGAGVSTRDSVKVLISAGPLVVRGQEATAAAHQDRRED